MCQSYELSPKKSTLAQPQTRSTFPTQNKTIKSVWNSIAIYKFKTFKSYFSIFWVIYTILKSLTPKDHETQACQTIIALITIFYNFLFIFQYNITVQISKKLLENYFCTIYNGQPSSLRQAKHYQINSAQEFIQHTLKPSISRYNWDLKLQNFNNDQHLTMSLLNFNRKDRCHFAINKGS